MPMKPKSKSKHNEPTNAEIAARVLEVQEDNRRKFRDARRVAAKAFGSDPPTPEMVVGTSCILHSTMFGGDADLFYVMLKDATALSKRFFGSASDTSTVFAVSEILLEDDDGEAHILDAKEEAVEAFGEAAATPATVIDVYYEIYGVDEEDEENEE